MSQPGSSTLMFKLAYLHHSPKESSWFPLPVVLAFSHSILLLGIVLVAVFLESSSEAPVAIGEIISMETAVPLCISYTFLPLLLLLLPLMLLLLGRCLLDHFFGGGHGKHRLLDQLLYLFPQDFVGPLCKAIRLMMVFLSAIATSTRLASTNVISTAALAKCNPTCPAMKLCSSRGSCCSFTKNFLKLYHTLND